MARARQAAHNAPAVIPPQGRLTLTTGTPVMTAEAASQTTIYYTPYVGDRVPLYNGTEWENKVFSELSIAMAASANWAADSNFDLFVYNDAGTLRLVTGAAWTNGTTRAEALVRTNGIWLNNASFTGRYAAASTVSIAASRATYVGTMRTSAAGTTTWELGGLAAGGDPGKLFIWNCYNRVKVSLSVRESTDTWTYDTAAWRSFNNSDSNRVSCIVGLAEDGIDIVTGAGGAHGLSGADTTTQYTGIGVDVTNAMSGVSSFFAVGGTVSAAITFYPVLAAAYSAEAQLGFHFYQFIEYGGIAGAGTVTRYGDGGSSSFIQFGMNFTGMF